VALLQLLIRTIDIVLALHIQYAHRDSVSFGESSPVSATTSCRLHCFIATTRTFWDCGFRANIYFLTGGSDSFDPRHDVTRVDRRTRRSAAAAVCTLLWLFKLASAVRIRSAYCNNMRLRAVQRRVLGGKFPRAGELSEISVHWRKK